MQHNLSLLDAPTGSAGFRPHGRRSSATRQPEMPRFGTVRGWSGRRGVEYRGMVCASGSPLVGLFEEVLSFADSLHPVLIHGETGVGKDMIARALHHASARTGDYFALNCSTLNKDLAESELFGHVAGAFTGAVGRRKGAFVAAHGGTLFLDELGELPLDLQPKLLRVLESSAVRPLGGTESVRVEARVVGATHCDLRRMVGQGCFRSDLLYRLDLFTLVVPPLRERPDDLDVLVPTLLQRLKLPRRVSAGAMRMLRGYGWPGNIRELRNVLVRAAHRARVEITVDTIRAALRPAITHAAPASDFETPAGGRAKTYLRANFLLGLNGGNVSETAKQLGIPRSTFYRWLHRGWVRRGA